MLIIHVALWCLTAALAILCAAIAFKRKWYTVGIIDVGVAFIDIAMAINTVVTYFVH